MVKRALVGVSSSPNVNTGHLYTDLPPLTIHSARILHLGRTVSLELSDDSLLVISPSYLSETSFDSEMETITSFEAGRELSTYEAEELRFVDECVRAEAAALRLVARAEQNSVALTAKLERRTFGRRAVKAVMSHLLVENLINDERYAESWIRARLSLRKAESPNALCAALQRRGISKKLAHTALTAALNPEDEYDLLLRYIEKSKSSQSNSNFSLKVHLKYEGFSAIALESYFDG